MKTLRYFCALVFIMAVAGDAAAQQKSVSDLYLDATTKDFATIRRNVEKYFVGKDKGRGSGYKQWKRWEYLNQTRLTPDGKVTNTAARNWEAFYSYEQVQLADGSSNVNSAFGNWVCKGPYGYTNGAGYNPGIGRVNVVCFHPTDANIFWVGTPAGGLWKTTTGGNSWTPLTDGMPLLGVSGIAVEPDNTDVMYILTGDGDGNHTQSIGVLKTVNGGVTWYSTGLTWTVEDNIRGFKLLMHPTDHNILFASTNLGLHKTTNGGNSWSNVLPEGIYDFEFKPGDPSSLYACSSTNFFRSTTTGNSWSQVTNGVPASCWRMAIGVSPANPAYVYLFTGPPTDTGYFTGVYCSSNSGNSFLLKSNSPNILGYASNGMDFKHQTTYDLAMTVSPTNVANIIVGGINTWKSSNYGATWTMSSMWDDYLSTTYGYTHADIHDLAINPMNNWLYCCSDGGIFRSTDFGATWTDLSAGLCHTQWYRIAGTESNVNLIIGGTQDNGCNKWTGGSTMQHILGADGMDCIIDYTDANIMFYEAQEGELYKSYDGGASCVYSGPVNATAPWVTTLIMSPTNHLVLYGGYDTIRKSTNGGASWSMIGVGQAWGSGPLAMGTNNTNIIYASNMIGIWRSDNGGNTWTSIHSTLPNQQITSIAVNPDNSSDVFVTFGNFAAGQKVYSSTTAGASWNNISGTLPNTIVNCVVYEDNNGSPDDALYIGTDIGIFYRNANMTDWVPFMNGLPNVRVIDLEINKTVGLIRAGTFGRGLWSSDLYTGCAYAYYLNPANDPSNPVYTGVQHYEADQLIESSRTVTGGEGTNVLYQAGTAVRMTSGFHVMENSIFRAANGTCSALDQQNKVIPVTGTFAGPMKE